MPTREYHFSKLGPDGWKALVEGSAQPPSPYHDRARALWFGPYDLPEHRVRRMTRAAARDLSRAIQGKRVPAWALNLIDLEEVQERAGEST